MAIFQLSLLRLKLTKFKQENHCRRFTYFYSDGSIDFQKKQHMKKILFITTIFISTLFLSSLSAQVQELKLSADIWPPFTDVKENKSILTVIVQEALYRRDINSTIEFEDWGKVLGMVDQGIYDGSPALWETPERLEKYHFSKRLKNSHN